MFHQKEHCIMRLHIQPSNLMCLPQVLWHDFGFSSKILSDKCLFLAPKVTVFWGFFSNSDFLAEITHHNDMHRLKHLSAIYKWRKKQVEEQGSCNMRLRLVKIREKQLWARGMFQSFLNGLYPKVLKESYKFHFALEELETSCPAKKKASHTLWKIL